MNEQEQGRIDRDGGDDGDRGGDSGLVQPPKSNTYRGPYGEPIVVPIADDPEGHPEYQPGHSDAAASRPAHDRFDAFLAAIGYPIPHFGLPPDHHAIPRIHSWEPLPDSVVSLADLAAYYRERDSGSGRSDHGPSERRDG